MSTLLNLHYLPSIAYFHYLQQAESVVLEAHEHYQKRSYRNRCHIIGANGVQRLSIPLAKGKNQQQAIRDVRLSYSENWPHQHWQSIRSAYGNSPFYPYYEEAFAQLYEQRFDFLWDLNFTLLESITQCLQWELSPTLSHNYQREVPNTIRDLRQAVRPNSDPGLQFPPYAQVFQERHGFVANLSILDLLFCQGPQADLYLSTITSTSE